MYKITTFNLRHAEGKDGNNSWQYRKNNVFLFLKENKSDIYCFQELLLQTKPEINSALNNYTLLGACRTKNFTGESAAIAFNKDRLECLSYENFWLSLTPEIPGSKYKKTVTHPRICTRVKLVDIKTNNVFSVYNTHLDHEDEYSKHEGLKLILNKIKEQDNFESTILCGDFNMQPEEVNALMKNVSLKDCSDLTNKKINYTFHDFGKLKKGIKIDYIFATKNFVFIGNELFTEQEKGFFISDHYPVTAYLDLPNKI